MPKYIINNTEVSRETYFDILNDLIDLAKDGMPLEIQFTPIPATHEDVNKLCQSVFVKTFNALEPGIPRINAININHETR